MSMLVIRQQLETAIAAAAAGQIVTVFENVFYEPIKDTAFQRVDIMLATPENPSIGDNFYREKGFVQFTLYYPLAVGVGDGAAWAQALRTAFPRGRSFVTGKVTTVISETLASLPAIVVGDRFVMPLRMPFFANVLP
jgi:hypothetical protein